MKIANVLPLALGSFLQLVSAPSDEGEEKANLALELTISQGRRRCGIPSWQTRRHPRSGTG